MGGVKVRPHVAVVLYALLVISGAAAMWSQGSPAGVPPLVKGGAPWLFLVFAIGLAVYRFALMAARRYSPFKGFFQVATAFGVFFLLLRPGGPSGVLPAPQVPAAVGDLEGLFSDPDPRVRALAAEVCRYRAVGPNVQRALVKLLGDPDEAVRAVAHQTLVQFNSGNDLGIEAKAWSERFP